LNEKLPSTEEKQLITKRSTISKRDNSPNQKLKQEVVDLIEKAELEQER